MEEKDYVVFSQKLAGYLMLNGCKLLKISPNKVDQSKNVFYFPNNIFVKKHVDDFLKNKTS